jgi:hypothetical protein
MLNQSRDCKSKPWFIKVNTLDPFNYARNEDADNEEFYSILVTKEGLVDIMKDILTCCDILY